MRRSNVKNRKMMLTVHLLSAHIAMAALMHEKVSDGSRLEPSVADGVRVYADETDGSIAFRVTLTEFGVTEALLYVGNTAEPVTVRHGTDVEILCDFDSFKVVPIRLVAGSVERTSGIAVYRSRGEALLVHEQDSPPSFLDARNVSPRTMDRKDGFVRFSARWNSGERTKVVAYRSDEYGKSEAQGIVLLDRSGTGEGRLALNDVRNRLSPGSYVFVHSDGVSDMVANVRVKIEGFIIICK